MLQNRKSSQSRSIHKIPRGVRDAWEAPGGVRDAWEAAGGVRDAWEPAASHTVSRDTDTAGSQ